MNFSELVARSDLEITVIVAAPNAAKRIVSGAYITDLPDPSRFVGPGDVVLTSGLWAARPGGTLTFLNALADRGVVGVIVGLIELRRLPDEVIALCRELGITLATISERVSFKTISETVAVAQSDSSTAEAHRSEAFRRDLAEILSRGDGALAGLRLFHSQYSTSSWMIDDVGTVIATVGFPPSREHVAAVWNGHITDPQSGPGVVTDEDENPWSIWPLISGQNRTIGYLATAGDHLVYSHELRLVVGSLVAGLRVEMELSSRWRDARFDHVSELVQLLVDDSASPGEISTRMRLEGLDPQLATCAVVAEVVGTRENPFPSTAAFELVSRMFSSHATQVIGTVTEQHAILLVNGPLDALAPADGSFERAAIATAETFLPFLAGRQLRVGISDHLTGVSQLGSAITVARERLAGVAGTALVQLASASSIHSHTALLRMLAERTRLAFAVDVLKPLVSYDAKHGAGFVETLKVFLQAGGSWQEAARQMHLHPNTLRYRIARIEELTGRNLATMDDRVDLYLALACLTL